MTQAEEIYWQGVIEKCAEAGIDPEELIKLSSTLRQPANKGTMPRPGPAVKPPAVTPGAVVPPTPVVGRGLGGIGRGLGGGAGRGLGRLNSAAVARIGRGLGRRGGITSDPEKIGESTMTQEEEIYWQGFINKCAEAGIDPEELLKQAQLGAALKSGAKGAWDVLLRAIKKLGATAAGKGVSQFGRGVAAPYKALGRAAVGKGIAMGPVAGTPEVAGRVAGLGAGGGAGLAGLLSLLGGGEEVPKPAQSPLAGLQGLLAQLRGE